MLVMTARLKYIKTKEDQGGIAPLASYFLSLWYAAAHAFTNVGPTPSLTTVARNGAILPHVLKGLHRYQTPRVFYRPTGPLLCASSVLQARLGLKAGVSAQLSASHVPAILGTEPVLKAFSVLGWRRPSSHGKLRLCTTIHMQYITTEVDFVDYNVCGIETVKGGRCNEVSNITT